jgi:hypothetical protein
MKKAVIVLVAYLVLLLIFSLIFSYTGINNSAIEMGATKKLLTPMMGVTVIGGIIALYLTVDKKLLKLFLIIYLFLWLLRIAMLYLSQYIGEVSVFGRAFRFDVIIPNYYENVSRITTPLPFILFWFINYLLERRKLK